MTFERQRKQINNLRDQQIIKKKKKIIERIEYIGNWEAVAEAANTLDCHIKCQDRVIISISSWTKMKKEVWPASQFKPV